MSKKPSFLFLVELSEKSEVPLRMEEHEGFEFCYKAHINNDLVDLTDNGHASIMHLDEQTLCDMSLCESLQEHMTSMLEIITDQLYIGSFVIMTSKDVIANLSVLLEGSPYHNRFGVIPFRENPGKGTAEYQIGLPSTLTDTGDYGSKHQRIVFLENVPQMVCA